MKTKPEFKIEANVPIPKRTRNGSLKYPWDKMKVGDSILVKCDKNDASKMSAARNAAAIYGGRHQMKFSTRNVEGGLRVWRTA